MVYGNNFQNSTENYEKLNKIQTECLAVPYEMNNFHLFVQKQDFAPFKSELV